MTDTDTARTQTHRSIAIDTPLGDDVLLFLAAHGNEALGRLSFFELDLFAEGKPVDAVNILGKNVTLRVSAPGQATRYFNGYISKFTLVGVDVTKGTRKIYTYRASLVPWTWFLTRSADCRIFQNLTAPDIIESIFREKGLTDFDNQLTGTYRTWEYCVQYRETDFNFISRMMENEGIYYYFLHDNGKHTLVMCDAPTAHEPAPGYDTLTFDTPDLSSTTDAFLWNVVSSREITSNACTIDDFNPLTPNSALINTTSVTHSHDPGPFEIYDYPGGFTTAEEGHAYVSPRMEEIEAPYITLHGTSQARGLHAGATFKLAGHPVLPEEEYLITAVHYQITGDEMGAGLGRGDGGQGYAVQITAMLNTYTFRPARITPKPVVQGPQTAIVVGESGQEITVDQYARVKVKFHWDRADNYNEKSSCWVRVAQVWAGKNWGGICIPRIGQEVIVDFLEGDPDRPIITGRVYNAENMPPYALPANGTQSGFKTNSSKGGGGSNELRFEDKKDAEDIFLHAQLDTHIVIEHDRCESVGNDLHLTVTHDKYEQVKNDRHEIINNNHIETIKNDRNLSVKGKEAKAVVGTLSLKVSGDVAEVFESKHSETTTSDYYLQADNIVIEGKTSITIKVGSNSIAIDKQGIAITSGESGATFETSSTGDTSITSQGKGAVTTTGALDLKTSAAGSFKATGALDLESQDAGTFKSTMAMTIQSSATLGLKGSMVNIN